jgi:hypothetical protein
VAIDEDMAFQRREWMIQRVGWVVILVLLIAGLLGALGGNGWLSHGEAKVGSLALEYERFTRQRRPTSLQVRVDPASARDGQVPIWLDQAFLDRIDVERVEPEPVETRAGADRVVYQLALADPQRPAQVTIAYQPADLGVTQIRLGIVGGDAIAIDQVVYP